MPYVNRKCNNCGKEYYVCYSCQKKGSWKIVCCSRDCFREYIKKKEIQKPIVLDKGVVNYMYIILQNDTKVKIVGYDLELERYDGEDGNTYSPNDFKELIISKEEFQKIIKN